MSNSNESSEDKQKRLGCYMGRGINNWRCYKDCAFWDGKKCTNYELEKETDIGVTWQEAFQAGLEGKKIKVYGQYLTYRKFESLHFALEYLSIRPNYYKDLLRKEWYIQKS